MNQPIKVLAVVYKLMPAGLENRLMDILRNIDSERVRIDIYTYQMEEGVYDDEVRRLGGKVYYNPALTVSNMFWYVQYFKKFLLEHPEYQIVHAHQDAWCSVFCKGAYLAGVPVRIAHSRTAISTKNLSSMLKNLIKLSAKKYANYYFAVSEKAGRWLFGNRLYDTGRVRIWPNAIDANQFYFNKAVRENIRSENAWNDKYVVMHVGNFTPPKNHPFIIEIFDKVRKREKQAHLVLVGTGDRTQIDKLICENMLEKSVTFLGSRRDVNQLLQAADVFLFPSIFEGLPGALVEAQASGVPCVISDTIAKEAHIVPNISVLSLTDNIEIWVNNVLDAKMIERTNAREYIEARGFDICSLSERLCDFYERAKEGEN